MTTKASNDLVNFLLCFYRIRVTHLILMIKVELNWIFMELDL